AISRMVLFHKHSGGDLLPSRPLSGGGVHPGARGEVAQGQSDRRRVVFPGDVSAPAWRAGERQTRLGRGGSLAGIGEVVAGTAGRVSIFPNGSRGGIEGDHAPLTCLRPEEVSMKFIRASLVFQRSHSTTAGGCGFR